MEESAPKHELFRMIVDNTIDHFLLENKLVSRGIPFSYSELFEITEEDILRYFEEHGHPALTIPERDIRSEPRGGEAETEWTYKDGLYYIWFTERNTTYHYFKSDSKQQFERYWINGERDHWRDVVTRKRIL